MAAALLDAPNQRLPELVARVGAGRFTSGVLGDHVPSICHLQQLLSAYVLRVRRIHSDKSAFLELLRKGHVFGILARYLNVDLRKEWRVLAANSPLAPLLIASVANPGVLQVFDAAFGRRPAEALIWASASLPYPEGMFDEVTINQRERVADVLLQHRTKALAFAPEAAFFGAYWHGDDQAYALRGAFVEWADAQGWPRDFVAEGLAQPRGGLKPRFGVASANWNEGSAIWRFRSDTLARLKDHYELVLVRIPSDRPADTRLFDEVVDVRWNGGKILDDELVSAGLDVLYFPETYTGLFESLLLGRRYAPLQVASYGIPVSTRAPCIDVFLTGETVEPSDLAVSPYSERTQVAAGRLGAWSSRRVAPALASLEASPPAEGSGSRPARVACVAGLPKWNRGLVGALREIGRAGAELVLLPNTQSLSGLLLKQHLDWELAGVTWRAYAPVPAAEYLTHLAGSDLMVDSYPYGGFTTLFDAISLGVPILAVEGTAAAGRTSAAAMRMAGLPELAASDWATLAATGAAFVRNPSAWPQARRDVLALADSLYAEEEAERVAAAFIGLTPG